MSRFIVLYNYNKYYNRIIKKKSTFQEYLNLITPNGNTPAAYRGFIRENENFDTQDGVYAQHVVNIKKADPQYAKIEHPDYLVLEQSYVEGSGEEAVITTKILRYFILEVTKIRGNQFLLSLRRDLLADYYNEVLNAPVFVEKGWVSSLDDPAIFNKESMSFNQIKTGELLLNKNKYSGKGKGWIVGYIAKEQRRTAIGPCVGKAEPPAEYLDYSTDIPENLKTALSRGYYYFCNRSITDFLFNTYIGSAVNCMGYGLRMYGGSADSFLYFSNPFSSPLGAALNLLKTQDNNAMQQAFISSYFYLNNIDLAGKFRIWLDSNKPADTLYDLYNSYNGKIYQKDGVFYRITVRKASSPNDPEIPSGESFEKQIKASYNFANLVNGSDAIAVEAYKLYQNLINPDLGNGFFGSRSANQGLETFKIYAYASIYIVTTEIVQYDQTSVTLSANRNENFDGPYDLFCMPMGEVTIKNNNTTVFTTVSNVALPMARGIAIEGTVDKIYDIQILPYCPFDEILNADGDIEIYGFTEGYDFDYIKKTVSGITSNVGIVLYPKFCKGTFDLTISNTEELYDYFVEDRSYVIRKKIKSETRLTRFVSPNFAGVFEINVQKNKGITSLNVDYFYKPYTPYIHVAPYFSGFYGQDYNDPKGLICSGDFSIATASSQWEKYQIENKNYEIIFNRQIENLDVNNSLAYQVAEKSSGIGVITSTITGAGAGAVAGAMVGSSVIPGLGTAVGAVAGAAVGAVTGGVSSAVGRKYDLEYMKKSQSEARSYAVDMYAYNLGNIKALPYSLTKVSTITPNNKIFPFIEVYDCTDEERAAFTAKLRYNGMTIMRIGKIADFLGEYNYVSGQLIRLTGIEEDSRIVAEIANEIKEGAYYYGTDSE